MSRPRLVAWLALALAALIALILLIGELRNPAQATDAILQTPQPVHREDKLVAICLPSQEDSWQDAGYLLKQSLEHAGYRVELAWGDGTAQGQAGLLDSLSARDVDCVVIAPADSTALVEAEAKFQKRNIPLLAYGSLLMNTESVSGYICYDYEAMGAEVAKAVVSQLTLQGADSAPSLELFMGSPESSQAIAFYRGVMGVLETYLTEGMLKCGSGRLEFEDNCIPDWSEENAAQACTSRLSTSYNGSFPDVCICNSDAIAAGVISALEKAGCPPENWPIVTGNGATQAGIQNLRNGKQILTVSTDAAELATACVAMADLVMFGLRPDFPLNQVYNNAIQVPTALCGFALADKSLYP